MVRTSSVVCGALAFVLGQEAVAVKIVQTKKYTGDDCDVADLDAVENHGPCGIDLSASTSQTTTCDATHVIETSYTTAPNDECPTTGGTEVKTLLNTCVNTSNAGGLKSEKHVCTDVDAAHIGTYWQFGDNCTDDAVGKGTFVYQPTCRQKDSGESEIHSINAANTEFTAKAYSTADCSGTAGETRTYTCNEVCHQPVVAPASGTQNHMKFAIGACSPAGKSFSTRISNSIPLVAILLSLVAAFPKLIG